MPKTGLAVCVFCWISVSSLWAQAPAGEHNCPSTTAIPPYVGSGRSGYSPNQNHAQGSLYVDSIRGVPGGADLWRWDAPLDGGPNTDKTLPFKYEGQPDSCGIYSFAEGGCANNVNAPQNLGVAPGGGDADIAVNSPIRSIPTFLTSPLPASHLPRALQQPTPAIGGTASRLLTCSQA
jgi:hypothetical protein